MSLTSKLSNAPGAEVSPASPRRSRQQGPTLLGSAAAVLLLTAAQPAAADLLTLSGIAAGAEDTNNNNSAFEVLHATGYATGRDSLNHERRWALEFDLASLPSGAVITAATLTLRTSRPNDIVQAGLSGYSGNGAIELADMVAGSLLSNFAPTDSAPFSLDVTAFVQSLQSSSAGWAGFNLRQTPLEASGSGVGDSWNGPIHFPAPSLNITYSVPTVSVPEPASGMLLVAALGGLALVRARRNSRSV